MEGNDNELHLIRLLCVTNFVHLAVVFLGIFPTRIFDSEPRVRGSSQGLPSLINEVMEHVERGNTVGIYDMAYTALLQNIGIFPAPWYYHIFAQWWWLLIIGIYI